MQLMRYAALCQRPLLNPKILYPYTPLHPLSLVLDLGTVKDRAKSIVQNHKIVTGRAISCSLLNYQHRVSHIVGSNHRTHADTYLPVASVIKRLDGYASSCEKDRYV